MAFLGPNELSVIERCPYYRGVRKERLNCIKPPRGLFISSPFEVVVVVGGGGEGLIETGSYLRGGSFNLEKTVESVLLKELKCKVETLKNKKLEVMQPRIQNKSELPAG